MLEIVLSVVATAGAYEYLYDVLPSIPTWATLPLIVALAAGVYFLPLMWLIIVAVASAAGYIHSFVRRSSQPVVINSRRSGLPPLP